MEFVIMAAFTVIEHDEVDSGGVSYVEFDNIPQTYNHLMLKISSRNDQNAYYDSSALNFNGDGNTGNNGYSFTAMFTTGNSVAATRDVSRPDFDYANMQPADYANTDAFSCGTIWIMNYTSSKYKVVWCQSGSENTSTSTGQFIPILMGGVWANTAAITSVKLQPYAGLLVEHSTHTLYGVKGA